MTRVKYQEEIKKRRQRAWRRNAPVISVLLSAAVLMIAVAAVAAVGTWTPADPARTEDASELAKITAEQVEIIIVAPGTPEIDAAVLDMLACAIYTEAGGDACSDLCRQMVGDVVLNRVEDPRFPDAMEEVLTQEKQYSTWYWTGIQWPERASQPEEATAVERAYDTARALLDGNHSSLYGQGYIWQAEFSQGSDVIHIDGLYFGR